MQKPSLIRTIYLYLFSLIGLVLMTIGAVNFVDMALKATIFTQADENDRLNYGTPPMPLPTERFTPIPQDSALTADERLMLKRWTVEYAEWQKRRERVDPVTAQRQREASTNLALLLVGLPLYLYHWRTIRKEKGEISSGGATDAT